MKSVQYSGKFLHNPPSMPLTMFAELNREALRDLAPESLLIMPLGATEQHGPHLPSGTDISPSNRLLAIPPSSRQPRYRSSTPALPFGSSAHHLVYGGTLSLSTETYYKVLRDLLESSGTEQIYGIFLLNGHGGNHELAQLAARDMALRHPVRVAAGSYWTIAWHALIAAHVHENRRLPGHAGDFETSIMLSLRPEIVSDKAAPGRRWSSDPRGFEAPGVMSGTDSGRDRWLYRQSRSGNADKGAEYRNIEAAFAQAFLEFYVILSPLWSRSKCRRMP